MVKSCHQSESTKNKLCTKWVLQLLIQLVLLGWVGESLGGKGGIKGGRKKLLNLLLSKSMFWHSFAIWKVGCKLPECTLGEISKVHFTVDYNIYIFFRCKFSSPWGWIFCQKIRDGKKWPQRPHHVCKFSQLCNFFCFSRILLKVFGLFLFNFCAFLLI